MKSDVYFIEVSEANLEKRCLALSKLLEKISHFLPYEKDELVPIKFTIGDSTCVYNLSPELVKIMVTKIKAKKAKPFVFDTNVIYSGERQNAVDHLTLAQNKGFAQVKIGAPYIVADGLIGQDGKEFEISSEVIKKIKVPSFIGTLDSLLVLSHATGHIISGYAGSIKNVAMGMVCRPTKLTQHSSIKPHTIKDKCTLCRSCIAACPAGAIEVKSNRVIINPDLCVGCGECLCACRFDAIFINWHENSDIFAERLVDVAQFILSKFKNKFFINFLFDITKECDCISNKNDEMVAGDIGILASGDILSLDKATMDLIDKHHGTLREARPQGVFNKMFSYAQEKKLGNLEYNLIKV
ncbi:MAG: DUF362 domain-containing protein [Candidatus Omnitrophota bacterium]|nr:DUF362 domain-containing protein [Candidatus Omnitrophota bacterium]